jgi:broad specificity phosphatase PhoE
MTTFYLLRHGEKDVADRMVSRMPGVHLTPQGRQQARALAAHLKHAPISLCFSSPLERTIETAEPLARALKLEIQSSPAFHELDMGDWTGISMKKLATLPSWKKFCRHPAVICIPGGETLPEAQARVVSEMIRLRARFPNAGIAIATHEDPIRLAICHFIGAPIAVYEKITIRLGSVTILRLDAQSAILDRLDEVPSRQRARRSA